MKDDFSTVCRSFRQNCTDQEWEQFKRRQLFVCDRFPTPPLGVLSHVDWAEVKQQKRAEVERVFAEIDGLK